MELMERRVGAVTFIDVIGRLRLDEGVEELRHLMARLVGSGHTRIVLNLATCPFIDSAGIGELATGLVRVRNAGGTLLLINLHDRVRELLHVTRLLDVFVVADDENAAVEAAKAS